MRTPRLLNFSHRPIPISPTFHSPYTLPSSVASNSFACHSYENTGGVGVSFPFWNRASEVDARHACPVPARERTQGLEGLARTLSESAAEINSPLATSRSPLTPLSATLTRMPVSVHSKELIVNLSPLDATLTKNRGWEPPPQTRNLPPSTKPRSHTPRTLELPLATSLSLLEARSDQSYSAASVLVHQYFPILNRFCTGSPIVQWSPPGYTLSSSRRLALTGSERRTTQRFSMRLPLTVRWTTGAAVGETSTESRDVSSRGVYFFLQKDVKEGSPVEILLTLPNEITLAGPVRVRCLGRVQRTESRDEGAVGVVAAIERYEFLRGDEDK